MNESPHADEPQPLDWYICKNPVVKSVVLHANRHGLRRVEWLELAVRALAQQNDRLSHELVLAHMLTPIAYITPSGEKVVCHVPDEDVPAKRLE